MQVSQEYAFYLSRYLTYVYFYSRPSFASNWPCPPAIPLWFNMLSLCIMLICVVSLAFIFLQCLILYSNFFSSCKVFCVCIMYFFSPLTATFFYQFPKAPKIKCCSSFSLEAWGSAGPQQQPRPYGTWGVTPPSWCTYKVTQLRSLPSWFDPCIISQGKDLQGPSSCFLECLSHAQTRIIWEDVSEPKGMKQLEKFVPNQDSRFENS